MTPQQLAELEAKTRRGLELQNKIVTLEEKLQWLRQQKHLVMTQEEGRWFANNYLRVDSNIVGKINKLARELISDDIITEARQLREELEAL